MRKAGDIITIYMDPIGCTEPEGRAVLVARGGRTSPQARRMNDRIKEVKGVRLEYWLVQFIGDGFGAVEYGRWI